MVLRLFKSAKKAVISAGKSNIDLFSADEGQTALGKKKRAEFIIEKKDHVIEFIKETMDFINKELKENVI
ncbi:MAG: hypothetical protein PHU12_03930 [Candidatus Aenigmarchaeota archaeon]|nr:hypothetical protein [Candidatus Aenigmarchaeota archaeon]